MIPQPLTFEYAHACASHARRDLIRRQRLTDDELATAAALFGIVADGEAIPNAQVHMTNATGPSWTDNRRVDAIDRMQAAVSVYGDWRACAINAHAWRVADGAYDPADPTAALRGSLVRWRAWPGDVAADYDASAERYNLGPSGLWSTYEGMPPIYAAGRYGRLFTDTFRPDDRVTHTQELR